MRVQTWVKVASVIRSDKVKGKHSDFRCSAFPECRPDKLKVLHWESSRGCMGCQARPLRASLFPVCLCRDQGFNWSSASSWHACLNVRFVAKYEAQSVGEVCSVFISLSQSEARLAAWEWRLKTMNVREQWVHQETCHWIMGVKSDLTYLTEGTFSRVS